MFFVLLIVLVLGLIVIFLLLLACIGYKIFTRFRGSVRRASPREPSLSLYTTFHTDTLEEEETMVSRQNDEYKPPLRYSKDDCGRLFEKSVNEFGLVIHSFRCRDEFNEFWEANFRTGQFRQPFVIRSLRSNARHDQVEYFKKLQTGAIGLPTHPNILKVIGLSADTFPYRIYYEYHKETTLYDELQERSRKEDYDSEKRNMQLLRFAKQIATGMEFLKRNQFDHVAVRTERILCFSKDLCKLFDFCLPSQSPKIAANLREKNEHLAWLAPETLWKGKYYLWTDIWAFGVVLWELWSLGKTPCVGKSLTELQTDLKYQRFLGPPSNCPQAISSLMQACWKSVPFERKPFDEIKLDLERLIKTPEKLYQTLEKYSPQLYSNLEGIRSESS